jgi:hypothetical protein
MIILQDETSEHSLSRLCSCGDRNVAEGERQKEAEVVTSAKESNECLVDQDTINVVKPPEPTPVGTTTDMEVD